MSIDTITDLAEVSTLLTLHGIENQWIEHSEGVTVLIPLDDEHGLEIERESEAEAFYVVVRSPIWDTDTVISSETLHQPVDVVSCVRAYLAGLEQEWSDRERLR